MNTDELFESTCALARAYFCEGASVRAHHEQGVRIFRVRIKPHSLKHGPDPVEGNGSTLTKALKDAHDTLVTLLRARKKVRKKELKKLQSLLKKRGGRAPEESERKELRLMQGHFVEGQRRGKGGAKKGRQNRLRRRSLLHCSHPYFLGVPLEVDQKSGLF